jgi:hypothetical protein
MSFQTYSIPTKIGSIEFYPLGFFWGNREAASQLSISLHFRNSLVRQPKAKDDPDDFFQLEAQNYVDNVIKVLKKEKRVIYVSLIDSKFIAFFDETLGDPDSFINGIGHFITTGDTRKFCCNNDFAEYCKILRRENGIEIDFKVTI